MEFSSILFLFVFLPIFLISYFCFKSRKYRNFVLLIFSLFFYAWGEPIYIFLMIISIIVNYFMTILIDKRNKAKLWLCLAIVFNLGLLVIFKYTDFIIDSFNYIFNTSVNHQNIALPIGISFYTFQALSYVIDVYLKKVNVQKNIFYLGCYITAFPQLIAGPIVKYSTVEKELIDRKENCTDFAIGIRRFITGLAKKVMLANTMGLICDRILNQSAFDFGFIGAWIAMLAYTFQIYYDFSGYSDMAIGLGKMLGFHFNENFNYPYIAQSITDFWRRWHISLSSWFKEYVYIPLGGNKKGKIRLVLNILIVWLLTGLWHGASFNFLLWGLYYGIILLIEKLFLNKFIDKWPNLFKHIYTMLIVIIGWTIFRNESIGSLNNIFKSMIGLNGIGNFKLLITTQIITVKNIIMFVLAILLCRPIFKKINLKYQNSLKYQYLKDCLLLILFIIVIINLVSSSYNPFIYFRF